MSWTHTYRKEAIALGGVITLHRPGNLIAAAVTELQERVAHTVDLELDDSISGNAEIADNVLRIRLAVTNPVPAQDDDPYHGPGSGGGDGLPPGGEEYQVLQRDATGAAVWDWVRAVDAP
jgi:hypothetical protein